MKYKSLNYPVFLLLMLIAPFLASAQSSSQLASLYEQASESSGLVVQYGHDVRAIQYFYGPMSSGAGGRWGGTAVANSPAERERLIKLNNEYLDKLAKLDFDGMSIYGQVDYILLKRKIEASQKNLKDEATQYQGIANHLPFANAVYDFEAQRRRGTTVQGEQVAQLLHDALTQLQDAKTTLEGVDKLSQNDANFAGDAVDGLKARLKNAFDFYNGYDPVFTWWVPEPYKAFDEALGEYAKSIRSKSDAKVFDDGSNIGGQPIGREELNRRLKDEMIAYSADELLKLADQEFAWCEAELLKASREMGFGDDWKAAQEKVKNSYVPAGKQPELIIKLNDDAINFIKANELMDLPPLAEETWGMIMMTPERQLVNPFFTGGREISVSYPTNTMSHPQKLMSMRGNNPYFSRGTVQHELVPGHHLQYFMNSRYKPYRREAFNTPFWTEGWTLYWELLLYDKGFAKTPEERIGMLFWRMHRCARITFSIKYHLGEWTPQQCIDYLVDRVGHEPANAHGEVKRSFEANYSPLYQLAYLVGGLQLMSIKNELVDSGKMTHKQFHDAVIKENYLPMELLRATLINQRLERNYQSTWKFYDFNK
ncbi:DUF885 domain-containing protein [Parapedobacter tibetensis]|uniref:DUF885 domain-containing protein n=1 Tax=Parapedobacter tibetensis TaxID=2972951 RepID=UPI00214D35A7|nr:DUF885 domain-containing protein [Parapedobacter tibetensis]